MKGLLLAASVATLALTGVAHAEGDIEEGEKVYKKCKACHDVGEDAKNKIGPQLNGVIGRAAGSIEDFKYSNAMLEKGKEGLKWDEEALSAYLEDPKKFLGKAGKMTLKVKKEDQRADVIAYLKTFNADGTKAE